MLKKLMKYKNNKGFTLIELIVVMAIIAILVLLAAPRFLGRTQDATLATIQNDIRIAEGKVTEMLISDSKTLDLWDDVDVSELEGFASDEALLGRGGVIHDVESDNYKAIPEAFVDDKINSKLNGDFYVNDEGDVFYHGEHTGIGKGDKKPIDDGSGYVSFAGWSTFGYDSSDVGTSEFLGWTTFGYDSHNDGTSEFLGWTTYGYEDSGITFEGLSTNAYDGNLETFHTGVGTMTWNGDLAGRELEITGIGSTWSYGTYPSSLEIEFLDINGNALPQPGTTKTATSIAPGSRVDTTRVHVPSEATSLRFFGTMREERMQIHNISVSYTIPTPTDLSVESEVGRSNASFDWKTTDTAFIQRDRKTIVAAHTGTSYPGEPLYSDQSYFYELEFRDELGNRRIANFNVTTASDRVLYRGLSPAAFDGNLETFHTGVGAVTWSGDLANRDIEITGKGSTGAYGTYPTDLTVEFLNSEGVAIPPVGMTTTPTKVAPGSRVETVRLTVPEEATSILFEGASRAYRMQVHNMAISYDIPTPSDIEVTSDATTRTSTTFNWDAPDTVKVKRNKQTVTAGVTGTSYTDKPLYSAQTYFHEVEFLDDYGNRRIANFNTETASDLAQFRGLSPDAFDGDLETYRRGVGEVTWRGDLANRDIEISGKGVKNYSSSYALTVEFLDADGVALPQAGTSDTVIEIARSSTLTTTRVTVPAEATRMRFSGSSRTYNMQIHNIAVAYEIPAPNGIQITADTTENSASFTWGTFQTVQVKRNRGIAGTAFSDTSYVNAPLYSGEEYFYELEFLDANGSRSIASFDVKTASKPGLFRGLTPGAFDDNLATYHRGVGEVTWSGNLTNKEVEITGQGAKNYSSSYALNVEFVDAEGVAIAPVGMTDTLMRVSPNDTPVTLRLTVPAGAERMRFSGSSRTYNMHIHNVAVIEAE